MNTSTPTIRAGKQLPTVRSPSSPYKMQPNAAKSIEVHKSPTKSYQDVLPNISSMSSPEGPGAQRPSESERDSVEKKAIEVWIKTAESGHAESQNNLAISYYRGAGVQKDEQKAVTWWSKAAQQGYAEAQYNLATCMMAGYGTAKDEKSAVAMFRAAADQEHPDAMCMVASFFADGSHGISRNLAEAVDMYKKAAEAGSEEAEYKLMVIDDLNTRENELNSLSTKISKINDGFIQLQLERAAHEEVTHAYKGAGFFLSNMKSEVPVRARIEMAQKAEKEIKHLRHELTNRDKQLQDTMVANAAKEAQLQDYQRLLLDMEQEKVKQEAVIKDLEDAKENLIIDKKKQRKQIEELLAENTELRTVAEWHKNQRVDALKQSLSAVVQTTIKEQNDKEKQLRSEIHKLRARLNRGHDGGGITVDLDSEEHASQFLKQIRKDIFIQEALLKEVMGQLRGEDYEDQIEFLRGVMGQADMSERFLASAVDQILDHTSETSTVSDEDALKLRHCLGRILNSMGEIKTKSGWEVQKIKDENNRLRDEILRMTEQLGVLTKEGAQLDEKDQRMVEEVQKQVEVMEIQAKENEALLAEAVAQGGHVDERVQEDMAQIEEAVKFLQREVRRPSADFVPNSESVARDLAILQALQNRHQEHQEEILHTMSETAPDASFLRTGNSSGRPTGIPESQPNFMGVDRQFLPTSSASRTLRRHSMASETYLAGARGLEVEEQENEREDRFVPGRQRQRKKGSIVGLEGMRARREDGQVAQVKLDAEALEGITQALAAMKEGLEERLTSLMETFSETAAQRPEKFEVVSSVVSKRNEDVGVTEDGKALERLQRKVEKILDIVSANPVFGQLSPDLSPPPVQNDSAMHSSERRKSTEGLPGKDMESAEKKLFLDGSTAGGPAQLLDDDSSSNMSSRRDSRVVMSVGPTGDTGRLLSNISEQINAMAKAQKRGFVEEKARIRREIQMELNEKTLRIQALEAENKALSIDLEKKELELKLAVQEKEKAVADLQSVHREHREQMLNEAVEMDEKIKAAQEEAQTALDDRDRLMAEAQEKIGKKEKEIELRKEVATQMMREMQAKNLETIRDIMEGFASKVALHLAVARSGEDGAGRGDGMSEEDLAALQEIIRDGRREGAEQRGELLQLVRDLGEELRVRDKQNRRAGMGVREGRGSAASVEDVANAPLPPPSTATDGGGAGGAWPLDPEAMDAVKQVPPGRPEGVGAER